MTDPIGTAQERELIEDLRKAAAHVRFSQTGTEASLSKVLTPAADALQSRIAEVGRLEEALDDVLNPVGRLRRLAEAEGKKLGPMAYDIANSIAYVRDIARAALSLQRRV